MENLNLRALLDYIWIPLAAAIVHLYREIFSMKSSVNKTLAILENEVAHHDQLRMEDRNLSAVQRDELLQSIYNHNKAVMERIDRLESLIREVGAQR